MLTHPPATAVGQGVRGSGVRMHTCQIDGVPVVQLSAPGVPNLLHLIVPLGSRGLPRLVPPPEQDLRPLGTAWTSLTSRPIHESGPRAA